MTTATAQPINTNRFVAEEPLSVIVTPHLKAEESAKLLACINAVRTGEKVFYVRLTNHKVTNGPKRIPPADYVADPALAPHAHEGLLVAAPINRKHKVYLRIHDEARKPDEGRDFGFTNISMDGIESFKVLGERPGPLAKPEPVAPAPQPHAFQQVDPAAMMAQSMFMMAQSMSQMAMALMAQAQQKVPK